MLTTNNIQRAAELILQCDNAPGASEPIDENHMWSLVNFAISQGRVAILEALVEKFKSLSINGRMLSTYCLYQSFRDGRMDCAQALQVFFPGEVFFCLPHAVEYDQVHMLQHFLPNFNPDATDLTALLIDAWRNDSEQCFDYLLPQCPHLDEKIVAQRCTPIENVEFKQYVCAQRQKQVLLKDISDEGGQRIRKM